MHLNVFLKLQIFSYYLKRFIFRLVILANIFPVNINEMFIKSNKRKINGTPSPRRNLLHIK